MSKIDDLIKQYCPDGVKFKTLGEIYDFQYGTGNTIPKTGGTYPVYGSNGIVGNHSKYNSENSPVIGHIGAYAGIVNYGKGKHFVTYNGVICRIKSVEAIPKYAYYLLLLQDFRSMARSGSQPFVSYDILKAPMVPIPPLAVQEEIVRILDTFTQLEAELEAELEARQQQYRYYRDQLLSFGEGVLGYKSTTLGNILKMLAGKHIKAINIADKIKEEHVYACYGGNGVRGFVKKYSHDGEYVLIGRQGALCGNVKRTRGKFYATEHAVVCTPAKNININWAFHILSFMNLNQYASKSAQPGLAVGKLEQLPIKVPPIAEQQRIVAILDKFDALVNDISSGLPAEINARRQQYEYYRNKLLTFKPHKDC